VSDTVSRVEDGDLNITKSGGYKQNSVPSFSALKPFN